MAGGLGFTWGANPYGSRLWYGGSFPGISLRVAGGPLALWLAGKPRKESPVGGEDSVIQRGG